MSIERWRSRLYCGCDDVSVEDLLGRGDAGLIVDDDGGLELSVADNGHRTWTDFVHVQELVELGGCGIKGNGTQHVRIGGEQLRRGSRGEVWALYESRQHCRDEQQPR